MGVNNGMNLIIQLPGFSLCGQACVAMACGISLEESLRIFGHRHATKTAELIRAIRSQSFRGIDCHWQRLKRFKKGIPAPIRL
jgi:hypothetical protein